MMIRTFDDPKAFQQRVGDFLLRRECENCVQIGLIERLVEGKPAAPHGVISTPMLLCVESNSGDVEMVAMQTPPGALLLTQGSDEATRGLMNHLLEQSWVGGINGPVPTVHVAVDLIKRARQVAFLRKVQLRAFQLDEVIPPSPAEGSMQRAMPSHISLLATWNEAFHRDINEPSARNEMLAAKTIEEGRPRFWVDGEPVAVAAWAGPTPNGTRVNFVYTPPKFRGKGYASNLVAALSQELLDRGNKFCFLFTDLANPTSNSIYQKLGYRGMSDLERWEPVA